MRMYKSMQRYVLTQQNKTYKTELIGDKVEDKIKMLTSEQKGNHNGPDLHTMIKTEASLLE